MRDWAELSKNDLQLPINGKTYTVPELDAATVVRFQAARNGYPDPELAKLNEEETWRLVMGDELVEQMIVDGVGRRALRFAGQTALLDVMHGRDMAEAYWEAGEVRPEAIAAIAAAAAAKTSTRSTSTGSAKKTPSRASTRTTTPRKASSKTANPSSGATSSRRGY
jgi:hypothetical protein